MISNHRSESSQSLKPDNRLALVDNEHSFRSFSAYSVLSGKEVLFIWRRAFRG